MANKREILNALATVDFDTIEVGETVITPDDITEFIETSLAQLDKRAAAAQKRANEKKAEGDELRANIKAVLEDGPKTIADIVAALDDESVTNAKVVARLTQLVKLGEAFKADTKVDGRTIKIYSVTPFEDVEE